MNLNGLSQQFDKCYFRPALYFQTIEDWQCADAGLEFKMNFTTQRNEGKFPSDVSLSGISLEKAKAAQLQWVSESSARPDTTNLSQRLRNAATWNKPEDLEHLIRTCYVPKTLAVPCLVEAAKRNFVAIVTLLVKAGASPSAIDAASGKNALHVACQEGQEDVCRILIESMATSEDMYTETAEGHTCFDLARANDLGFMARRLERLAKERFESMHSGGGSGSGSECASC